MRIAQMFIASISSITLHSSSSHTHTPLQSNRQRGWKCVCVRGHFHKYVHIDCRSPQDSKVVSWEILLWFWLYENSLMIVSRTHVLSTYLLVNPESYDDDDDKSSACIRDQSPGVLPLDNLRCRPCIAEWMNACVLCPLGPRPLQQSWSGWLCD